MKLSLINGFLIGFAIALGAWGLVAFQMAGIPVPLKYPSLIVGSVLLIGLGVLTGWLTGRMEKAWSVVLVWGGTAVIATMIIIFQPYYGRTFTIWLADRRFWGLSIYPYLEDLSIAQVFVGFFLIFLLAFLALLQNYRLEGISSETGRNGRLNARAWMLLMAPLPFVIGVSWITQNIVGDPSSVAIQVVDRAIERGRTYEGDLFELGLREGISYGAIRNVREKMSANYILKVAELDPAMSTIIVAAHFDNDAWINCRVINNQISYCYDAAEPYAIGLNDAIHNINREKPCPECDAIIPEEWQNWLHSHKSGFGESPKIKHLEQWGGYVLMQIESQSGRPTAQCWFEGVKTEELTRCEEVGG
jgi:hypothetical protein